MSTNTIKVVTRVQPFGTGRFRALMLPVYEGDWSTGAIFREVDRLSPVKPRDLMRTQELRGEFKEFTILHLPPGKPFDRIILMGMGPAADASLDRLRSISAKAARTLRKIRCDQMVVVPSAFPSMDARDVAQAATEGLLLGLYKFDKMTRENLPDGRFSELVLLAKDEPEAARIREGAAHGQIVACATNSVRTMANEPPNVRTPRSFADTAREIASRRGLKLTVLDEKRLEKLGMGGILAVSKGSREPARLILLEYRGAGSGGLGVAFVGKGITFDSGGISIKPAAAMHQMKFDMSGAGAVLGAVDAIAGLKLPINVTAVVPTCENLPGGQAYKPGDVIKMYAGKFVEIINTDAEGRMILADALAYASRMGGVDLVVDLATLTGGCVIALGHIASGVMGNNSALVDRVVRAGNCCEEKMWAMPMFDEYLVQIKSGTADLVNSGGSSASTITAGMFLKQFVSKPWAHVDIAGTAWIEEDTTQYFHKPYLPKRGATGVGVRSLVCLAEQLARETEGRRDKLLALLGARPSAR